jgi:hypothetical protein
LRSVRLRSVTFPAVGSVYAFGSARSRFCVTPMVRSFAFRLFWFSLVAFCRLVLVGFLVYISFVRLRFSYGYVRLPLCGQHMRLCGFVALVVAVLCCCLRFACSVCLVVVVAFRFVGFVRLRCAHVHSSTLIWFCLRSFGSPVPVAFSFRSCYSYGFVV